MPAAAGKSLTVRSPRDCVVAAGAGPTTCRTCQRPSSHANISSVSSSFSNSGAKRSMICCGCGHRRLSVMRPNGTPPYERMLTPTPMLAEAGQGPNRRPGHAGVCGPDRVAEIGQLRRARRQGMGQRRAAPSRPVDRRGRWHPCTSTPMPGAPAMPSSLQPSSPPPSSQRPSSAPPSGSSLGRSFAAAHRGSSRSRARSFC